MSFDDVPRPRRSDHLDGRTAAKLFEMFRLGRDRGRIIESLRIAPHIVDAAYVEFKKGSLDRAYKQSKRREKTLAEIEREEKRDRDFDRSLRDAQRMSEQVQVKLRAVRLDFADPLPDPNFDLDDATDGPLDEWDARVIRRGDR